MKRQHRGLALLTLAGVFGITIPAMVSGQVEVRDALEPSVIVDELAEASGLAFDLSELEMGEVGLVVRTVLEFHVDALSPGDVVELWVASDEGLPWRQTAGVPHSIGEWRADERTGSLVRFDLAQLISEYGGNEAGLPVLIVRRAPNDDGEWSDLDLVEGTRAELAVR